MRCFEIAGFTLTEVDGVVWIERDGRFVAGIECEDRSYAWRVAVAQCYHDARKARRNA